MLYGIDNIFDWGGGKEIWEEKENNNCTKKKYLYEFLNSKKKKTSGRE